MKVKKGILLLLVMTLLFGIVSIGAGEAPEKEEEAEAEPNVRIYYINVSTSWISGDCILIESDGHYGLIDAGHRRQNTITDQDGKTYYCSATVGLSCDASGKNGESIANILVRSFNITHLDFVIGTHAHSDHIGGIPGLVNYEFKDADNVKRHLVDETTVYFYKQYHHTRAQDDDLPADGEEEVDEAAANDEAEDGKIFVLNEIEEKKVDSWHSQAFYYQAVKAMKEQGCILADLSVGVEPGEAGSPEKYEKLIRTINRKSTLEDVTYNENDPNDLYDDSLSFTFGKAKLWLYNLLPRNTVKNENINSIVAALDDGTTIAAFTGDINVEGQTEQRIMSAILNEVGRVNLLKAAHHGAGDYSNSRDTFDMHQPEYVIVTSKRNPKALAMQDAFMTARIYAERKYGTAFYEAGATRWALLAELSDDGIALWAASGNAAQFKKEDPEIARYDSVSKDGWALWENEYPDSYEVSEGEWAYFKDGEPLTGWVADRDRLYYFDEDGLQQVGLTKVDGEWYYFWSEPYSSKTYGSMVTGWLHVAEGLFYFNEDGTKHNGWLEENGFRYYFPEGEPASTGWTEIDGDWYFFDENGVMQTGWQPIAWPGGDRFCFLGEDGAMCFGWQEIEGERYYFGRDGVPAEGWQEIDGERYFFDEEGHPETGWLTQKDGKYFLDDSGVMQTGWLEQGEKTYYLNEQGRVQTGWITVDGKEYYMTEDGGFMTGWQRLERDGKIRLFHFDKDGVLTFTLG